MLRIESVTKLDEETTGFKMVGTPLALEQSLTETYAMYKNIGILERALAAVEAIGEPAGPDTIETPTVETPTVAEVSKAYGDLMTLKASLSTPKP
jgi:hypothetical protein